MTNKTALSIVLALVAFTFTGCEYAPHAFGEEYSVSSPACDGEGATACVFVDLDEDVSGLIFEYRTSEMEGWSEEVEWFRAVHGPEFTLTLTNAPSIGWIEFRAWYGVVGYRSLLCDYDPDIYGNEVTIVHPSDSWVYLEDIVLDEEDGCAFRKAWS